MPGGDRTGPMGMGSMTGRGAGYCSGSSVPGYANNAGGRGFFGRGGGRGFRNRYFATGLAGWRRPFFGRRPAYYPYDEEISVEEEKQILKDQQDALKKELDNVKGRIKKLENEPDL